MNAKRLLILLVLVLVVAMIVPTTSAQEGGIVTIIYTQEPDTLNPLYSGMWYSSITADLYLSPAWFFDDDLNAVPVLVTEIPSLENGGLSEDGTVLTMTIRDDVVWSDGEAINADDFVFTYEMWMAEGNLVQSRYPYDTYIDTVTALDDTTVEVVFYEPFAPWLSTLFLNVLPEHVLAPVFEAEGTLDSAEWNRAPYVGAGPFVFEEWESGGFLSFVRNDNYFNGTAKLDGVFIRIVPDDAAQIAALIDGEADFGTFMAYSDLLTLEEAGVSFSLANSGYNEHWTLNVREGLAHPAMLDVRVRRALELAAPRQVINETLLYGGTYVPATYWEGSPYNNPDIEPVTQDLDAAAALLDEAGWVDTNDDAIRDKDGVDLVLRYLTPPRQVRMDTQVVVQQVFRDLGIGLVLSNPSYDVFWNTYGAGGPIATGQYDIGQWSQTSNFPDPDTSVFLCDEIPNEENPEGANDSGYCDEEVDALFYEQATTMDAQRRIEIFHDIGAKMAEDVIWIGLWYDPDVWAVHSRVLNSRISGADSYWNAVNWEIAD